MNKKEKQELLDRRIMSCCEMVKYYEEIVMDIKIQRAKFMEEWSANNGMKRRMIKND